MISPELRTFTAFILRHTCCIVSAGKYGTDTLIALERFTRMPIECEEPIRHLA